MLMKCVSQVSYKIKINGLLSTTIEPQRGLRQGDLLSPYLFIIAAEVFTFLIDKAREEGRISRVKITPAAPTISHLLFADNCIIFSKDNEEKIYQLVTILNIYTEVSRQRINLDKSGITFRNQIPIRNRVEIEEILGLSAWDKPGFCDRLSKRIAKFWWASSGKERGIHWKSWDKVCASKKDGVLKAVYFPNEDFKDAKVGRAASWMWKSIVHGRDFLLRNEKWLIGNGERMRILEDKWIMNMDKNLVVRNLDIRFVKDLLVEGEGWNLNKLKMYFDGISVDKIVRTWQQGYLDTATGRKIKCNVDAAFDEAHFAGATAVVLRDHNWTLLSGINSTIVSTSPLAAEALAVKAALIMSQNFQMQKVIIESDNQILIQALKSHASIAKIQVIVEDILHLVRGIPNCGFTWVPREANSLAQEVTNFTGQIGEVVSGDWGLSRAAVNMHFGS
ncbi:uncharacterized protein [Arachis hypogaea]|uniref:uncharacterized protein n=1 Tax=Arachis hypogaea TaxID=3818 RepID=UPI003B228D36